MPSARLCLVVLEYDLCWSWNGIHISVVYVVDSTKPYSSTKTNVWANSLTNYFLVCFKNSSAEHKFGVNTARYTGRIVGRTVENISGDKRVSGWGKRSKHLKNPKKKPQNFNAFSNFSRFSVANNFLNVIIFVYFI